MTKICKCMANCPHGPSPDSPPQIVSAPDVERADDFVRRRKTASGTLPKYWSEWVLLMAEYASSSNAALEQERNLAQSMHRAKDIIAAKLADEVLGLRTERDRLQGELAEISGGDGFRCGMLFGIKGIFEGGCGEHVSFADSYRCSDCTASFHRDCLRKHFKTHGDMVELRSERDGLREALRDAQQENERLTEAWMIDETIGITDGKDDGSLRPAISKTIKRAADAENELRRLRAELDESSPL